MESKETNREHQTKNQATKACNHAGEAQNKHHRSKFQQILTTMVLALLSKQTRSIDSKDTGQGIVIFREGETNILEQDSIITNQTNSSYIISKVDDTTDIFLGYNPMEGLKSNNDPNFVLNLTNSEILASKVIRVGKNILDRIILILTNNTLFMIKQDIYLLEGQTKQVGNFTPGDLLDFCNPSSSEAEGRVCSFVRITHAENESQLVVLMEIRVRYPNLAAIDDDIYLVSVKIYKMTTNELRLESVNLLGSVEDSDGTASQYVYEASKYLKIDQIRLTSLQKVSSDPLRYQLIKKKCVPIYLYVDTYQDLGLVFFRYCPINAQNVQDNDLKKWRNTVQVYLVYELDDAKVKISIRKLGEFSRYTFDNGNKFKDDYFQISRILKYKQLFMFFDLRGYGYIQNYQIQEFNARVLANGTDLIEHVNCDALEGGTLSCILVNRTAGSIIPKFENNITNVTYLNNHWVDLRNRTVKLIEFTDEDNAILKIQEKVITTEGDALFDVIHFESEVFLFTAPAKLGALKLYPDPSQYLFEVIKRRDTSNRRVEHPLAGVVLVSKFLPSLAKKESLNGFGFYLQKSNSFHKGLYILVFFTDSDPSLIFKPIVNLTNSVCERYLENCASTNLTFTNQQNKSENYSFKGYIINEEFDSILCKVQKRNVKPTFKLGELVLNIDNYYLGTIRKPMVLNNDYVMPNHTTSIGGGGNALGTKFGTFQSTITYEFKFKLKNGCPDEDEGINFTKEMILSPSTFLFHKTIPDGTFEWVISYQDPESDYGLNSVVLMYTKSNIGFQTNDYSFDCSKIALKHLLNKTKAFPFKNFVQGFVGINIAETEVQRGGWNTDASSTWSSSVIIDETSWKGNDVQVDGEITKIKAYITLLYKGIMVTTQSAVRFYQTSMNQLEKLYNLTQINEITVAELVEGASIQGQYNIIETDLWKNQYLLVAVQEVLTQVDRLLVYTGQFEEMTFEYLGQIPIFLNTETEQLAYYKAYHEAISSSILVLEVIQDIATKRKRYQLTEYKFNLDLPLLTRGKIIKRRSVKSLQVTGFLYHDICSMLKADQIFKMVDKQRILFKINAENLNLPAAERKSRDYIFMYAVDEYLGLTLKRISWLNIPTAQIKEDGTGLLEVLLPISQSYPDFDFIPVFLIYVDKLVVSYFPTNHALKIDTGINYNNANSNTGSIDGPNSVKMKKKANSALNRISQKFNFLGQKNPNLNFLSKELLATDPQNKEKAQDQFVREVSIKFNDLQGKLYQEVFHISTKAGFEIHKPEKDLVINNSTNSIDYWKWGVIAKKGILCGKNSKVSYTFNRKREMILNCDELQITKKSRLSFQRGLTQMYNIFNLPHPAYQQMGQNFGKAVDFDVFIYKKKKLFLLLTESTVLVGQLENGMQIISRITNLVSQNMFCFKLQIVQKVDLQKKTLQGMIPCQARNLMIRFTISKVVLNYVYDRCNITAPSYIPEVKADVQKVFIDEHYMSYLSQVKFNIYYHDEFVFLIRSMVFSDTGPKSFFTILRSVVTGDQFELRFVFSSVSEKYSDFNTINFYVDRDLDNKRSDVLKYTILVVKKSISSGMVKIDFIRAKIVKNLHEMKVIDFQICYSFQIDLPDLISSRIRPLHFGEPGANVANGKKEFRVALTTREIVQEVIFSEVSAPDASGGNTGTWVETGLGGWSRRVADAQADSKCHYVVDSRYYYSHIGLCPTGSYKKAIFMGNILLLQCVSPQSEASRTIFAIFDKYDSQPSSTLEGKQVVYPADSISYSLGNPSLQTFVRIKFSPKFSEDKKIYFLTTTTLLDEYEVTTESGFQLGHYNYSRKKKLSGYTQLGLWLRNCYENQTMGMVVKTPSVYSPQIDIMVVMKDWWMVILLTLVYLVVIICVKRTTDKMSKALEMKTEMEERDRVVEKMKEEIDGLNRNRRIGMSSKEIELVVDDRRRSNWF